MSGFILFAMKKSPFTLRGFKRPGETVKLALGSLEREVMETVWTSGKTTVRETHTSLKGRAAYTTLLTTFDRLHKKRLLKRQKESRAFVYSPRVSRDEFEQIVARDVIDVLLGRNAEPVLACIVDAVGARDRNLLDILDRLVQKKRRTAGQEEKGA